MKEFNIGDSVHLDRYNHIDDVEVVTIIGYGELPISGILTYKCNVNGVIIDTTGICIKESKNYVPCLDIDRHPKKYKYNRMFHVEQN